MTTITRENAEIKSFITGFLSDSAHDNQSSNSLLANVFRIALASLEAEPVAWECGENIILFNPDTVEAYAKRAEISPKPLYAAPPVPVIQADVAQAIENLKQKLVECNRYNYCADAVKGVEDACRAAMLHGAEPVSQTYKLNELSGNSPVTPDGWISCSERMPEETGDIIIVSDGIVMSGISYSRRDGFYIAALEYDDDEPIGGVTHWMPLPEPPRLKEL